MMRKVTKVLLKARWWIIVGIIWAFVSYFLAGLHGIGIGVMLALYERMTLRLLLISIILFPGLLGDFLLSKVLYFTGIMQTGQDSPEWLLYATPIIGTIIMGALEGLIFCTIYYFGIKRVILALSKWRTRKGFTE